MGEGVSPRLKPSDLPAVQRFRDAHGLPDRYILFIGTFEPRKNLARLVAAYEQTVRLTDAPDHLVLCGGAGWKNSDVYERIEGSPHRKRIHVLGYLAEEELAAAYTGCTLFVYPSLAEVANKEKMMPRSFISPDGFAITAACRKYLAPLIAGEDYPPYKNGLPSYVSLRNQRVTRRLKTEFVLK